MIWTLILFKKLTFHKRTWEKETLDQTLVKLLHNLMRLIKIHKRDTVQLNVIIQLKKFKKFKDIYIWVKVWIT